MKIFLDNCTYVQYNMVEPIIIQKELNMLTSPDSHIDLVSEAIPCHNGVTETPAAFAPAIILNAICPDCGTGMIRLGCCFSCPACGFGSCG